MSFVDKIPEADRQNYTDVSDWAAHYSSYSAPTVTPSERITLNINRKIFINNVYFNGTYLFGLKFKNCYFKGEVGFSDLIFKGDLIFDHCFFDSQIYFGLNTDFNSELRIVNAAISKKVIIIGGKFENCRWSFVENPEIKIEGGEYRSLIIGFFSPSQIGDLSLNFANIKGDIKVRGDIGSLHLKESSSDVSISIEDANVNYLSIYRFRNEKSFRLLNIRPLENGSRSEVSIFESYMGKSEFYSFFLNLFSEVNIVDSSLVDCSFVNIDWNFTLGSFKGKNIGNSQDNKAIKEKIKKIETGQYINDTEKEKLKNDSTVLEYYFKSRETLRQLKYALSKQGDVINEQKFHSREMMAYVKTLVRSEDENTRLIINFSHWFSDFGQSISKPLLWLLAIHWILFMLLVIGDHFTDLKISTDGPTFDGFVYGVEYYFKLINPLRRDEEEFHGFATIMDIIMRIWSSYMIYNFVRASRRFIK